jgi:galactonate dehydratase
MTTPRITDVTTYLVGNPWKNWVLVRVDTDAGVHGVGEGSVNGFAQTVETCIGELRSRVVGLEVSQVELLHRRCTRELYTDGGQIQEAAVAAIEIACWDALGKACGQPVHALLGGRVRDHVPVYANGWYRHERTPEAFAASAAGVVERGYRALKFDPFGSTDAMPTPQDERLSIEIVAAVREAVGADVELMIEAHSRFTPAAAMRIADRLAPLEPAWFEEPVPHHDLRAVAEVARRSPIPVATGESFSSPAQFAHLLALGGVSICQPEPLHLGGLWRTRQVAALADAHHAVIAPHNAQGPICSAVSLTLGACVPNFYVQESFDAFNADWTADLVAHPFLADGGVLEVRGDPGLGVTVDWDAVTEHPYEPGNVLRLFEGDWQRRSGDADEVGR